MVSISPKTLKHCWLLKTSRASQNLLLLKYPSCCSINFSIWQFTLVDESPKLPKWSSALFPFPPASSLELIWSNFLREVSFLLSSLFSHSACLLLKTTYCNSSETLPFANHHLLTELKYLILFFWKLSLAAKWRSLFFFFPFSQQICPTCHSVQWLDSHTSKKFSYTF